MSRLVTRFAVWHLWLLLGCVLLLWAKGVVLAGGPCDQPANLTVNCDFRTFSDRGGGRVVADGWDFWVLSGSPAFDVGQDSPVPPSQRIWTDGVGFVAGLRQRVTGVVPGATYRAGVVWAPYTGNCRGTVERRVGVDPTGNTDPQSPTVVWSPPFFDYRAFEVLEVSAVAQANAVTVFVFVGNPRSCGVEQVFIDGVWLMRDESVPVQPSPTATQLPPPTATPVPTLPPASPTPSPSP